MQASAYKRFVCLQELLWWSDIIAHRAGDVGKVTFFSMTSRESDDFRRKEERREKPFLYLSIEEVPILYNLVFAVMIIICLIYLPISLTEI